MAAEKKKSERKAIDKKPVKKAAANAKVVLKKTKGKDGGGEVGFVVPRGGQVIKYFNLMPALPTKSGPGDWIFTECGSSIDIASLSVGFELNPSALEREFERAILVINIQQYPAAGGTWRFALGGVATDHGDVNPDNDIALDIIDNGFTLLVYVHALENNDELIPFGFVASFTESKTGKVSIYESKDPIIIVDRPPKP